MPHGKNEPSAETATNSAILTKAQTCALLSCTPRFLEKQIAKGYLRACKPSKKFVRILRKDVDAYLERFASVAA